MSRMASSSVNDITRHHSYVIQFEPLVGRCIKYVGLIKPSTRLTCEGVFMATEKEQVWF